MRTICRLFGSGLAEMQKTGAKAGGSSAVVRWGPLAAVAAALALGYALGLHEYFSLGALRRHQASLVGFVGAHTLASAASYVVAYAIAVAISFPGASFLTIAGGLLFGWAAGTALAWAGATMGATVIFLVARTSLGHLLAERAGPRLQRLRRGFQEEGFSYLLFLRRVVRHAARHLCCRHCGRNPARDVRVRLFRTGPEVGAGERRLAPHGRAFHRVRPARRDGARARRGPQVAPRPRRGARDAEPNGA